MRGRPKAQIKTGTTTVTAFGAKALSARATRKGKPQPPAAALASAAKAVHGAVARPLPNFVEPCLATLVAAPPEGADWVHEIKFDGYRIEARIDRGGVTLLTRGGLDWTERFGALPALLAARHSGSALIDGEIVVEDKEGRSSFSALTDALKSGQAQKFVLQCFDLLYLDGYDLTGAALLDRKELLQKLIGPKSARGQIRFSEHFSGNGAKMLAGACGAGLGYRLEARRPTLSLGAPRRLAQIEMRAGR